MTEPKTKKRKRMNKRKERKKMNSKKKRKMVEKMAKATTEKASSWKT